jgi:3-hydroxyacyl-CoA dehydrogenase
VGWKPRWSATIASPRALSLARAIDLILGSEILPARELGGGRLFDRLIEGDAEQVLVAAMAFAREHIDSQPLPLIRSKPVPDADASAVLAAARARLAPDDVMAREALNAIAAGVEAADFEGGMAAARAIYDRLIASDEVRKQRDRFFAARDCEES